MENINLIETFSEFKDLKNIDRVTMMSVLEDVFRGMLLKKFETDENFDIQSIPVSAPGSDEMLLRTLWLSLDPYMRGRMSDRKSYAKALEIGCNLLNLYDILF